MSSCRFPLVATLRAVVEVTAVRVDGPAARVDELGSCADAVVVLAEVRVPGATLEAFVVAMAGEW